MTKLIDIGVKPTFEYKQVDAGKYDAVIHAIILMGVQKNYYQNQETVPTNKVKIVYEIPSIIRDDGLTTVIADFSIPISVGKKGNYLKLLKKLLDNPNLDGDAAVEVELESLLGKAVLLTVSKVVSKTTAKENSRITDVALLDSRLPQPVGVRKAYVFNPLQPDIEVFKGLVRYTQKEIMEALNADKFPIELHEAYRDLLVERQESTIKDDNDLNMDLFNTAAVE